MKKAALTCLLGFLILSTVYPAYAAVTIKATVGDNVFVTFDIENLDPPVYDQAVAQINAETIPKAIVSTLNLIDLKQVQYSFGSDPLVLNGDAKTIESSFFLSGSDVISFEMNRTSMKRSYEVNTSWRKFELSLTSNFTLHFAERLDTAVSDWQKSNATTFFFESQRANEPDMTFYLYLPGSAQSVRVDGDTVFFEMPSSFGDLLLDSPFLILAALAVALVVVLIYRRLR